MIYNFFLRQGRKYIVFFLALIFLILSCSPAPTHQVVTDTPIKVRWVVDGDTFILQNGEIVRLKGIDAPEIAHKKGDKDQYFGKKSLRYLIKLIGRKYVILKKQGLAKDNYGRILAYVFLPDGTFLNELLVKEGYAFYFPHKDVEPNMGKILLQAQRIAMAGKKGFWKRILSSDINNKTYIGNKNENRFHRPTCLLGKKIYWKHKVYFNSLYDAFYAGYAPCRRCTPWPRE